MDSLKSIYYGTQESICQNNVLISIGAVVLAAKHIHEASKNCKDFQVRHI